MKLRLNRKSNKYFFIDFDTWFLEFSFKSSYTDNYLKYTNGPMHDYLYDKTYNTIEEMIGKENYPSNLKKLIIIEVLK